MGELVAWPNRVSMWLLGVVVVGLGINWLSALTADVWWRVVLAFVAAALLVLTLPGGFFSTPGPLGRLLAVVLIVVYVASAPVLLGSGKALATGLVSVALLGLAAAALSWRSLLGRLPLSRAALGVATLLGGCAYMVVADTALRGGNTLGGVTGLVMGGVLLASGVAALRGGNTLVGVTGLVMDVVLLTVGGVLLASGVAALRGGNTLVGVTGLVTGVVLLVWGLW